METPRSNSADNRHAVMVSPAEAGSIKMVQSFNRVINEFQIQYENPNGRLYQGHSFDWLESLNDASVDMVFTDPPYNIKKADWDNFEIKKNILTGRSNGSSRLLAF